MGKWGYDGGSGDGYLSTFQRRIAYFSVSFVNHTNILTFNVPPIIFPAFCSHPFPLSINCFHTTHIVTTVEQEMPVYVYFL